MLHFITYKQIQRIGEAVNIDMDRSPVNRDCFTYMEGEVSAT